LLLVVTETLYRLRLPICFAGGSNIGSSLCSRQKLDTTTGSPRPVVVHRGSLQPGSEHAGTGAVAPVPAVTAAMSEGVFVELATASALDSDTKTLHLGRHPGGDGLDVLDVD
jgi:hypothetical protein